MNASAPWTTELSRIMTISILCKAFNMLSNYLYFKTVMVILLYLDYFVPDDSHF